MDFDLIEAECSHLAPSMNSPHRHQFWKKPVSAIFWSKKNNYAWVKDKVCHSFCLDRWINSLTANKENNNLKTTNVFKQYTQRALCLTTNIGKVSSLKTLKACWLKQGSNHLFFQFVYHLSSSWATATYITLSFPYMLWISQSYHNKIWHFEIIKFGTAIWM